jgi:hypothetical protein
MSDVVVTDKLEVEMRHADNVVRFYMDGVQIRTFDGGNDPDLNLHFEIPVPFGQHSFLVTCENSSHNWHFEFSISANGARIIHQADERGGGGGVIKQYVRQLYNPTFA